MKIDTGADVTAIPFQWYKENLLSVSLGKTMKRLYPAGKRDNPLSVMGEIRVPIQYKERSTIQTVYVVHDLAQPLLGKPAIAALQFLKCLDTVTSAPKETVTHHQEQLMDPVKEFPEVFTGLGKMAAPYVIRLKADARPRAASTPRKVPIPLLPKLKLELESMVKQGIIAPIDEPTPWCAHIVIVPKDNATTIRVCIDLTYLNENVESEHHPLPSVEHILAQISGAKLFFKIDANHGFWQVPLDPTTAKLTTFITPFGRYYCLRLPFGITSGPELFQKRMEQVLAPIAQKVCLIDDTLGWGTTVADYNQTLRETMKCLKDRNITLRQTKCCFGVTEVKFLGHVVNVSGVQPDPAKVEAVTQMAPPTNVEELRRFLGMINFLTKFVPHAANTMVPLTQLLSSRNHWLWGESQQTAFQEIKSMVCNKPVLALFDPNKKTTLTADASSYGLGAALLQVQSDLTMKPVIYVSRTLSPTEVRYAQIEKEGLAVAWACDRLKAYIIGITIHIETDHKPLVPIFSVAVVDDLTPRLQRLRIRMMRYKYTISHVPGRLLVVADTLSRAPLSVEWLLQDQELQDELEAYVHVIVASLPATDKRIEQVKTAQRLDDTTQQLKEFLVCGWPDKAKLPPQVSCFWAFRHELSEQEGLILKGTRLYIPRSLRDSILDKIHEGHLGITKCRARAREAVWWPGIGEQIQRLVDNCKNCNEHRQDRREPLQQSPFPSKPWDKLGADLFVAGGKKYLLVTDYYSRFPEVVELKSTKSADIIEAMKEIIGRHGIPLIVRTDNGPQFSSEFQKFAQDYGFHHITSSPRYPQSNGFIENSVKNVKLRLLKSADPHLALMAYRAAPLENGFSPAQLLYNRRIRTTLPTMEGLHKPDLIDGALVQRKEQQQRGKDKWNYDRHHAARPQPSLHNGESVWVKDLKTPGKVVQKSPLPRSYMVETRNGVIRRNRRHLVRSPDHRGLQQAEDDLQTADDHVPEEQPGNETGCARGMPEQPTIEPTYYITRSGREIRPPQKLDL